MLAQPFVIDHRISCSTISTGQRNRLNGKGKSKLSLNWNQIPKKANTYEAASSMYVSLSSAGISPFIVTPFLCAIFSKIREIINAPVRADVTAVIIALIYQATLIPILFVILHRENILFHKLNWYELFVNNENT